MTGQPMQGALAAAFVLLAEAQVTMVTTRPYSLAWWMYHLLMLAGVTLALRALTLEWTNGRPVRAIVEGALDLEVTAGVELENVDSIAALAAAIELKDHDTQGHTVRVAELAVRVGREMGLDNRSLRVLARAGLLHDIGKLGIPDKILVKPGPLDDDEWRVMRTHPELGLDILARCGILPREAEIIMAHHERMDGSGYPRGLEGPAIPIEARIIAVADTYDVLLSDRPYRRALPHDAAVQVLRKESGANKLYPAAVEALLRVVERTDELRAQRLAQTAC
jgi:putative nucleotidyltransferase with HDIG domain